mgnify:FL=1
MTRPYTYVDNDTAKVQCIKCNGISKRKNSIMIYSKWGNMRYKYRNREFWCRGYYVDTVGKNTKKIKEYIANQLKEDKISDQMTIEEIDPFKG